MAIRQKSWTGVQTHWFPAESGDLQWQSCIRNIPCPRGTPKAAGRLGTRRGAREGSGLGCRPASVGSAGFLQLGAIIAGFEKFLLSGQREWVCLSKSTLLRWRLPNFSSTLARVPIPGVAVAERASTRVPLGLPLEQLGLWALLIPNQLHGAAGSPPQPWAVRQGLLSTAELSSCVRVPPCCPPGQPVWFLGVGTP